MNYIDKIVFRMFKTLTDEQKYDLLEKLTLENKELKEQLTLTNVVKQSEQFNCYEMHVYSRFDGCNKQCKECADNEKSKAI